jgi:hypothetical protein
MIPFRTSRAAYPLSLLLAIAFCPFAASAAANTAAPSVPAADLAAYRSHLNALIALVDRCQQATDLAYCDSKLVGADDRIQFRTPQGVVEREVRYDWLRDTLTRAVAAKQAEAAAAAKPTAPKPGLGAAAPNPAKADTKAPPATPSKLDSKKSPDEPKPDAQALLADARLHLQADQQTAQQGPAPPPDHRAQRQISTAILAQAEFDQIDHPSLWNRSVEAFFNWLNNLFGRIPSGSGSHWLLWLFEWGLVIAASTGLGWWLIQGSRRERWRLESAGGPRAGAPSQRDWQLWLAEAETFAAKGEWREAVHNVYWAAISRLESRGLWPVDRARTPREYLGLLSAADPRRADLNALTCGFERIWYGYRPAAEAEYRSACDLLEKLVQQRLPHEAQLPHERLASR